MQELTVRRCSQASNRSGSRSSGQVPPGAEQRVLDRVARELRVPEDEASRGVQPRDGRPDEHGEGVMIASPRPLHEPSLVHGRLVHLPGDHGDRPFPGPMASAGRFRFSASSGRVAHVVSNKANDAAPDRRSARDDPQLQR